MGARMIVSMFDLKKLLALRVPAEAVQRLGRGNLHLSREEHDAVPDAAPLGGGRDNE